MCLYSRPPLDPLSKLYSVSYLWIGCFSMAMTILVGIIVSLASGKCRNLNFVYNGSLRFVGRTGREGFG